MGKRKQTKEKKNDVKELQCREKIANVGLDSLRRILSYRHKTPYGVSKDAIDQGVNLITTLTVL